jgi:hypothetical protein
MTNLLLDFIRSPGARNSIFRPTAGRKRVSSEVMIVKSFFRYGRFHDRLWLGNESIPIAFLLHIWSESIGEPSDRSDRSEFKLGGADRGNRKSARVLDPSPLQTASCSLSHNWTRQHFLNTLTPLA